MSENAVAIREEITESKVMEYLDSAGITNSLLDNEKQMFYNIAREFGLNPFKREIHIVTYGKGEYRKCSIITGYEVYLKRAERTGKLDGWKVWTEGEGKNLKAIVEIYRKDKKYPFTHEVYYDECVQLTKEGRPREVWAKQPRFMTKKVAIGQAFRLCFPDDLGGMPYEESELPQEEPRNVTERTGTENEGSKNNGADLAHTAQEDPQEERGKAIVKEIGEILKTLDPNQLPYFTNTELDMERALIKGSESKEEVKNQRERLKKELAKREAAFNENISASETVNEEFDDDIPCCKDPPGSSFKDGFQQHMQELHGSKAGASDEELDIF